MRRARRHGLAIVIAATTFAAVAGPAQAAPTTIGFDDQADGTVITGQYAAADAVEFGKFTGGTTGNTFIATQTSPSSLAQSAPNVALMGVCTGAGKEFPQCNTDNYIRFNVPQSSVSFRLGFLTAGASAANVAVTAFNSSGNQVGSANPSVGTGVHTLVTVNQTPAGAAVIAYLHIQYFEVGDARHDTALDDLTFDNGGATPQPDIGISSGGEVYIDTSASSASAGSQSLKFGRFSGSTGPVSLAIAGLPPGVAPKFAANPYNGPDGGTDLLTLTAAAGISGSPMATVTVTATPSASAGTKPVSATFHVHVLNGYSSSTVGISLAQAAGDRAQTGPSGSSVAYNGVPLVSGRSTLVRVFADPAGLILPGSSGLTGKLFGSVNGNPLPGSPLSADQGGPPALGDQSFDAQLGQAATAFNFVLPASWTKSGPITLNAQVTGPGALLHTEPDPSPNATVECTNCPVTPPSLTLTGVGFTQMPPFVVTPVQLVWLDVAKNKLRKPGNAQAALALAYLTAPVGTIVAKNYVDTIDISALQFDSGGVGGDAADGDAQNMLVQWAQTQFSNDGNVNKFGNMVMGLNDALARGMSNSFAQLGNDGNGHAVSEPISNVDVNRQISSIAHEMGHNFGRLHADNAPSSGGSCGGGAKAAGGSDPNWPDYKGFIEPTKEEANSPAPSSQVTALVNSYGVDLTNRISGGGTPFVIYPKTTYDFMSYCAGVPDFGNPPGPGNPGSDWISARGWEQAFVCLESPPAPSCPPNQNNPATAGARAASATGASPLATAAGPAIHGPSISFLGYLDSSGKLISPSLMPTQGGSAGAAHSSYVAQLTDSSGKVISTEALAGHPVHLEAGLGHAGVALTALQGFLPTHGKTVAGLALRVGGRLVARIRAPRHRPRVKVAKPRIKRGASSFTLRWRSGDPDRARRIAFVAVSTNGRRFTTIWEGIDRGAAAIPVGDLKASRVVVRVSVSDGFHVGVGKVRVVVRAGKKATARAAAQANTLPGWELALRRAGIRVIGG